MSYRFFGQLLLLKAVERSANPEVRSCLPNGWENWVKKALAFMQEMAPKSPTIGKDLLILQQLYDH